MKLIKLQPSPVTDSITEDGHELTQRPYPFFVQEDGTVQNDFIMQASRVWGFQDDLAVQHVDLRWDDVVKDPQLAVGKYLVSVYNGQLGVHSVAIASVEVVEPVSSTEG